MAYTPSGIWDTLAKPGHPIWRIVTVLTVVLAINVLGNVADSGNYVVADDAISDIGQTGGIGLVLAWLLRR
jgi:hypothetical protein